MAEHKYAQVLRWIADGKRIRGWGGGTCDNERLLTGISEGNAHEPEIYSLAPRIITINGRDIEAPIDQIKSGEYCYCADSTGDVTAVRFDEEDIKHRGAMACGRLFSTAEAARDAFSAFTLLLLQGEK